MNMRMSSLVGLVLAACGFGGRTQSAPSSGPFHKTPLPTANRTMAKLMNGIQKSGDLPGSHRRSNQRKIRLDKRRKNAAGCRNAFA